MRIQSVTNWELPRHGLHNAYYLTIRMGRAQAESRKDEFPGMSPVERYWAVDRNPEVAPFCIAVYD